MFFHLVHSTCLAKLRVLRKKKRSTDDESDVGDDGDDEDGREKQRKTSWWKRLKTNDTCLGRARIDFRDYVARPCSTVEVQLIGVVCKRQ